MVLESLRFRNYYVDAWREDSRIVHLTHKPLPPVGEAWAEWELIVREDDIIARNERTRSYVSVYLQYIFRLCICRKCIDAIERLVFTAATAIIVVAASDTHIEKEISG